LKRIIPILSIILLTAFHPKAQENRNPVPNGAVMALKLYPNPATAYITFDLQSGYQKGMTITVFNFLGKKMIETPNVTEKTTLTLTDFNRGVYIYHVTNPNGKVIDTGKFQVSR
jgi:Secretion system C-terminal sorting domain